jgi:ribosome-associated translation inhibitor RaiA
MRNIVIQTLQFRASKKLERFVKDKVSKLFDNGNPVIRADVTLFRESAGNPENQTCEIEVSVPGDNHFIRKSSDSYEKSVLAVVRSMKKVIRRKKSKGIDRKRSLRYAV